MIDFQAVLFDALWILGLAGVLATFSYLDWVRLQRGWRWRSLWDRPCFVVPLSVSLALFCVGVGLSGATSEPPDPWWQTTMWGLLALLFVVEALLYTRAARVHGWEAPVSQARAARSPRDRDLSEM